MLFAVFSKTFAIADGLLPPDPKMDRLYRIFVLEIWLVVGALLVALGLGGALSRVVIWERHGFGELDPTLVMRIVIPSGLSLALGCQIILSAFFLSLLRMRRK